MGYQMSDYELRAGYIAIRTAEDMERISGKKVVANDALIHVFSPYFYVLPRMWSVVVSKSRARFTRS